VGCIVYYTKPVWFRAWRKLEAFTATGLIAALSHNARHVTEPRYGSSYSPSDVAHTHNALTEFRTNVFHHRASQPTELVKNAWQHSFFNNPSNIKLFYYIFNVLIVLVKTFYNV